MMLAALTTEDATGVNPFELIYLFQQTSNRIYKSDRTDTIE